MKLLALDTSTEQMSLAVQRVAGDQARHWRHEGPGGARTSTQLIPAILALMAEAELQFSDLDAIVLGAGPGSFTGLRTAFSVAQGLAFGADVPVLPVPTLLAVAEDARARLEATHDLRLTALLDARMDELYSAGYAWRDGVWTMTRAPQLIRPDRLNWNGVDVLAGNVFEAYGARLPGDATRLDALPSASALLRLAPALLAAGAAVPAAQALPIYIRDKVAQTTQERAAARLAAGHGA